MPLPPSTSPPPALRLLIARLIRRQARRDRQLQRDAAALGLWLQHLDPDDSPPPIPLPRLTRRQTRLLADTLAHHLLHPPIQSIETAPETALPDTPDEKNRRTQSNRSDSDPPPKYKGRPPTCRGTARQLPFVAAPPKAEPAFSS